MEHQARLAELLGRKQPLQFTTDPEELVLLPARASNATQALADTISDSGGLYRWPANRNDFIGCVPSSELVSQGFQLGLPTLFNDNVDELPGGGASLSAVQLDSIRTRGSFQVPSGIEGVPAHEWTLSAILVRGSEPAQRSWCQSLADWYESMAFNVPELVVGKTAGDISIVDGFYELYAVMQDFCRVSCGGRHFEHVNSQRAIEDELQRQQVEGLRPVRHLQNANMFPRKWEWQRDGQGGNWLALDFSLLAPEVQRMLRPRLDLLQKEVRRRHRQKLASDSTAGIEDDQDDWAKQQWLDTQLEVMADLTSEFPMLAPQLVAISVFAACRDSLQKRELRRRTEIGAKASVASPIRALSKKWRSQYVDQQLTAWRREVEHAADNVPFEHIPLSFALTQLRTRASAGLELDWWIRLLEIEFRFRCSSEPRAIEAALIAARRLRIQERHALRIWLPSNWKIVEHTNLNGTNYSVTKYEERIVQADLGWRFHSLWEFTRSSAWNGCFYAIVAAVWGPTGVKALFSPNAFYPDSKVNSETGEIETDKSVKMESYTSRLCNLWSAIEDMRRRFEKAPDNGILSKGVMRPFHYLWVYGICGFGGSTMIIVGQPVLTAITLAVSGVTLATFVIWAPGSGVARWAAHAILYDPHEFGCMPLPRMICRAALGGVGRIALAAVGVIVLPVVATVLFGAETIRFALRRLYDETMLNLVIKQCGRIPNGDSFLARRTAGPGISATCYYQVSPGVALAAMRAELELLEIDYIENELINMACKPMASFKRGLVALLKPLRLSGEVSHPGLRTVEQDAASQRRTISEVMNGRRKELRSLWNFMGSKSRSMRLSAADLQRTLESASALAQQFASQRLLHRLDRAGQLSFWDRWDLAEGDWTGFGKAMLAKAFSAAFVEASLEDLDENGFHLEVAHPGLDKLLRAVYSTGNASNTADIQAVVEPLLRVLPCAPQRTLNNTPGPAVALSDLFDKQPMTPANALRALWVPNHDEMRPHEHGTVQLYGSESSSEAF